jgi:integrase
VAHEGINFMSTTNGSRRSYGSGSLTIRTDANGQQTWYGLWWSNTRRVKRRIGPKRTPGTTTGLTRAQAEAQLRHLIAETTVTRPAGEPVTIADVTDRYLTHIERRGRKPSTRQNIESEVRVHIEPYFADRALSTITPQEINDFVIVLEGKHLAAKTIRNVVATLSALFNFARSPQRNWTSGNPCDGVELPAVPDNHDIRFLTLNDLDQLIDHTPTGDFQPLDRALWRTAAMTGLRKGELLALRWQDIDWMAQRVRVRQNYVRGEFGTPKSKRSTRSVPLADEAGGELERLFKQSRWQADSDLVFAHPATGGPLHKANVLRRMRRALTAANLDETHRFHDLRHTFGTHMAAAGVPMRTLQEWMGHRDIKTTQIYADYSPSSREAEMIATAFDRRGSVRGSNLSESHSTSDDLNGSTEPNQS